MTDFRTWLSASILLAGSVAIFAQPRVPSRADQVTSDRLSYIEHLHDSVSSPDRRLINGAGYYPHQKNASNHPFFREEGWLDGTVTIRGHIYRDLLMRYDIFLDQPLLLYIEGGARTISMSRKYIDGFTLGNDRFIHLGREQDPGSESFDEGFYQVVYDSELTLLVQWKKNRIRNEGFRPDEFQQERLLILGRNGEVSRIRNDRQLRKSLGEHNKELRKFMQLKNIHVNRSDPRQIALVLDYFSSLNEE